MLEMLPIVLISVVFLSLIALPVMIIGGQILSITRKRSAYEKCAKQISLLSCLCSWLINIVALWPLWQRLAPHFTKQNSLIHPTQSAENITSTTQSVQSFNFSALLEHIQNTIWIQAILLIWASLLLATILTTLCHVLWPVWKKWRLPYQCTLIIITSWMAWAFYGTMCFIFAENAAHLGIPYPATLTMFFQSSFDTSIWNALPYVPPLAFAMAGGTSAVWLILRRNSDDFGRDYYATMLPWCATWARNAWFIMWVLLLGVTAIQWIHLIQEGSYLQSPAFLHTALLLLLWVIPGVLWTLCIKSATPLRHKATLILALVLGMCIIVPLYMGLVEQVI